MGWPEHRCCDGDARGSWCASGPSATIAGSSKRPSMKSEVPMKVIRFAVLAALVTVPALAQAQTQGSSTRQIAARTAVHAIPSLTLSDQQFLAGDTNGKPATVTGEFRIAQGTGRLPVVVLIHGSGGMGPNIQAWARELDA